MRLNLYGWMPDENKEILSKLIKEHNVKTVLEIGCFLGLSTSFFVEQGCKVISIDTFEGSEDLNRVEKVKKVLPYLEKQFRFNLDALGITDKVTVLPMSSLGARDVVTKEVDLIYIDGSHLYKDVILDIGLWYPLASKVLCGDDYTEYSTGVRKAVNDVLPNANTEQRVWYLIK